MATNIRYQQRLDGITATQLQGFFAGWPQPPSPTRRGRSTRSGCAGCPMTTSLTWSRASLCYAIALETQGERRPTPWQSRSASATTRSLTQGVSRTPTISGERRARMKPAAGWSAHRKAKLHLCACPMVTGPSSRSPSYKTTASARRIRGAVTRHESLRPC